MGEAMPKLRTWVEMSGARKKNVWSGKSCASFTRSLRMYSGVGEWPSLSARKICPSAEEMSAPSLSDRFNPL